MISADVSDQTNATDPINSGRGPCGKLQIKCENPTLLEVGPDHTLA
jgi:hypothetical protein